VFNVERAPVTVSGASIGTVIPPVFNLPVEPDPAVFIYRAEKTGQETLTFLATLPRPMNFEAIDPTTNSPTFTLITYAGDTFKFEVRECQYKVTLNFSWQVDMGEVGIAMVGYMAETKLILKPGNKYEGIGSFAFSTLETITGCSASFSDFDAPTRITGQASSSTLSGNLDALELNFEYGKGTIQSTIACDGKGGSPSHEMDVSVLGVPNAKFSARGQSRSFPTKGVVNGGTLMITVEPEDVTQ